MMALATGPFEATTAPPSRKGYAPLPVNDIRPESGVIAVRFWYRASGQAMVQAIEIGARRSQPGVQQAEFQFPPGAYEKK
jgi:hypothetical protein